VADWVASLDIDGWSLGLAVRSAVVDAVADAMAARSLDAVVMSDVPTSPLTPVDRI
jgi:hypothetical protein